MLYASSMKRLWPAVLIVAAIACSDVEQPADWELRCPDCGPGEICVLPYDGLCGSPGPGRCVATSCTGCTAECDRELCGRDDGPALTCMATPCTTLPAGVFACYGP